MKLKSHYEEVLERLIKEGRVKTFSFTSEQMHEFHKQMTAVRNESRRKQAYSILAARNVILNA